MKVLIVDDERNIRESLQRILQLDGLDAVTAGNGVEALSLLAAEQFDVVVTDLKMPVMGGQELMDRMRDDGLRCPVIMISAQGEIHDAITALKSGAIDYLIKPFEPDDLVYRIKSAVANRKRDDALEAGARTAQSSSGFIGQSPAAQALDRLVNKVAGTDATVLVTGESGSGKEVVAREIHARSPRAAEPFVAVNIGGIHENLMESELFGHEKGAFTGADARKTGLFELAGSGSLFLDEIGEMPQHLQVKLLRVLQERKIRRLGGSVDVLVSARILSATNRDIEAAVREGRFREDLYYRLNVVRVDVPPLRDRREDIPVLAGFLLEKLRGRMGRRGAGLSPEALDVLSSYSYPGNVRELENMLERALIYADGERIVPADLGLPRRAFLAPDLPEPKAVGQTQDPSLESMERQAIERALTTWGGNRTKAARELGISRRTILNKIKRWGLDS